MLKESIIWETGFTKLWQSSPPTIVARDRCRPGFICGLSLFLVLAFFSGFSGFSASTKTNTRAASSKYCIFLYITRWMLSILISYPVDRQLTCFTCLEVSPGNHNFNTSFGPKQCLILIPFHFHRLFTSHPVNSIYLMDYFGPNIERTRLTLTASKGD